MPDSIIIADRKINAKANFLKGNGFQPGEKVNGVQEAGWGGWFQDFQNCRIYSHHSVGTYEVHGGILKKLLSRNGVGEYQPNHRRELGFPKSDEVKTPAAFPVSYFEWGEIIFVPSTDGGVSISGEIYKSWKASTSTVERYGYPIISNTRKGIFEYVLFERGIAIQNINFPHVHWMESYFPLLGNPAVINIYDNQLPFYFAASKAIFTSLTSTGHESTLLEIFADHLVLEEVRNKQITVSLAVKRVEDQPNSGTVKIHIGQTLRKPMIGRGEKPPTLYNISAKNDNGGTSFISPHAIFHRASWNNFGLLHATDIHVARRNDIFKKILREKLQLYPNYSGMIQTGIDCLNNWNNGFRDFIRYANSMYKLGIVDGIIATGDLVDYLFEHGEWKTAGGNFKFFRDLILGYSPYPEGEHRAEELLVPIFVTLGNHDYRVDPYEIYQRLDIRGYVIPIPDQDVRYFSSFNLVENEARVLQGGNPARFSDDDIGRIKISEGKAADQVIPADNLRHWQTDHLLYFKKYICREKSYLKSFGLHKLVMIDSGPDVGAPDGSWDKWDAFTTLLDYGDSDENAFQLNGSPNSVGPGKFEVDLVNQISAQDGIVILGTHAPLINIYNNEYAHYFRESEIRDGYDFEIFGFLIRAYRSQISAKKFIWDKLTSAVEAVNLGHLTDEYFNLEDVKRLLPSWFSRKLYFKHGSALEYLNGGVSRGKSEELLRSLCGLNPQQKVADLILTGHDHTLSEMRFKWDPVKSEMQYFTDFYTSNPIKTHNTKKNKDNSGNYYTVQTRVKRNSNPSNVISVQQHPYRVQAIEIPPYPNPLNNVTDPISWWNAHKPIQIQGAPLGPTEHNNREPNSDRPVQPSSEGCKLIVVRNDVINKIFQVNREELGKAVHKAPSELSGVFFGISGIGNSTGFDVNPNAGAISVTGANIDVNSKPGTTVKTGRVPKLGAGDKNEDGAKSGFGRIPGIARRKNVNEDLNSENSKNE